ncbi:MAG: NAD(P)H-binding protein [Candidatus Dormiibacterota bacterium]
MSDHAPSTVLVLGATGHVGTHVVEGLRARGIRVRAFARHPRPVAGVESVAGDVTDRAALRRAADGVDGTFLLWPVLETGAAAGAVSTLAGGGRRLVYLSAATIDDERAAGPIADLHQRLESLVRSSPARWTLLRAGGFATNTLAWAPQIQRGDEITIPFPLAARSLVHERDLADVAVRALTEPGHAGRHYALTGPEALTQAAQIAAIGAAIGRSLRAVDQAPEDALRDLVAFGLPAGAARGALDYWAGLVQTPEAVSGDVAAITGRPARTFTQWAREHAAEFAATASPTG